MHLSVAGGDEMCTDTLILQYTVNYMWLDSYKKMPSTICGMVKVWFDLFEWIFLESTVFTLKLVPFMLEKPKSPTRAIKLKTLDSITVSLSIMSYKNEQTIQNCAFRRQLYYTENNSENISTETCRDH